MDGKRDLNKMTARQLCKYSGLPVELARALVSNRRSRGPFCCFDQLWQVSGMNLKYMNVLKDGFFIDSRCHTEKQCPNVYKKETLNKTGSAAKKKYTKKVRKKRSRPFDTVVIIDKDGTRVTRQAKSIFMQESPSGNNLSLQCSGIKYPELTVNKEVRKNKISQRPRSSTKTKFSGKMTKDEYTRTEDTFWNKIYSKVESLDSFNDTAQSKNAVERSDVGKKDLNSMSPKRKQSLTAERSQQLLKRSPGKTSVSLCLSQGKKDNISKWLQNLADSVEDEKRERPRKRVEYYAQQGTSGEQTYPKTIGEINSETPTYTTKREEFRSVSRRRQIHDDGGDEDEKKHIHHHRHRRHRKSEETQQSRSSCNVM